MLKLQQGSTQEDFHGFVGQKGQKGAIRMNPPPDHTGKKIFGKDVADIWCILEKALLILVPGLHGAFFCPPQLAHLHPAFGTCQG